MSPITRALPIIPPNGLIRYLWYLLLLMPLAAAAEQPLNDDKPFATAHIILQLSDADTSKQAAVLDVANNLIKHYGGPEQVDIEIIAFGPGIILYEEKNPLVPRIRSLMSNEVRFVVCKNTLDTLERVKGRVPTLIDGLIYVQTGVVEIIDRVNQGYVLVRP